MTPREGQKWPPLPLMRNEVVIEAGVDRNELTRRETEEAIRFIAEHRDRPFMLIISHAMPGSTQAPFASAAFRGKSRNGPWGDSVEELDWSAGEVLGAVRRLGLDDNTVVIWTSDNSAPRRARGGSNAPLSGFMNSPAEGGMRVPFLARWPRRIPAGTTTEEMASMMDLLPTFAWLAGATAPGPEVIDGKNIWPLLADAPQARTPYDAFYYYHYEQLQAVRSGPWKLFVPLERQRRGPSVAPQEGKSTVRLYNVVEDGAETRNLAAGNPEIVTRLMGLAERARRDIGDLDLPGRGERPAGYVFQPQFQTLPKTR